MDWKDKLGDFLKNNPDIPQGEEPEAPEETPQRKSYGSLKVAVERKGHRGKTVTIIHGFTCDDATVEELASSLKRKLGTGGSARSGEILIQGDRAAEVREIIKQL